MANAKWRHGSWKGKHRGCSEQHMHMQHTVADAERVGHNLNHRRRSHVPPLLPLSAPFFLRISHTELVPTPSSNQQARSKSKWTAVQLANVDGFRKAPVLFRTTVCQISREKSQSLSLSHYRQQKHQKPKPKSIEASFGSSSSKSIRVVCLSHQAMEIN